MFSANDIPWEVVIFLLIFAVVLFYFIFFQGYLTAAIYRCIIKCFLPKNLSISFKYIQFSILSGHILIRDLSFTNLSMRVEIARLLVSLKYWSKIPEFGENDKNDDNQNVKNINNLEWVRSSHESNKNSTVKKKKGIFKTIFDRKSRFIVNIAGLHITLFNQSEDAISRIEQFRNIYGLDKKNTDEATKMYNEQFSSPPPHDYQLSILMRIILPVTFKVNYFLISIINPNLPSKLFISSKKIKGIFTMLKREDENHSLKQRLSFHMKKVKIRSVPNEEFDKTKLIENSMRCLHERFELDRTILNTDVINVIYTQDAYGCYIRSEDKDKVMNVTADPKMNIQVGIMSAEMEYGSYVDKLRSAFMRYFKPFLYINPTVYPDTKGRVKYMELNVYFFGDVSTKICLPFTTSQGLNESLIITFENTPESSISMMIPQYVPKIEDNKMEVFCNFFKPKIRTTLSDNFTLNLEDDESVIIKSSTLLVQYLTFSPEKWFEKGFSQCGITFERCKMKLAPYHIDFLTDLGTDFVATYPFEPTIDDIDFFQPSDFYVSFKMVDTKIQLLSKTNPNFENIFLIRNHQRTVIRTPQLSVFLQMSSEVFHEAEKSVFFNIQIASPMFKFFLPNDNMNQFRRNCYKWAHKEADQCGESDTIGSRQFNSKNHHKKENENQDSENDDEDDDNDSDDDNDNEYDDKKDNENEVFLDDEQINHKYVKHEYLDCSSITLDGSYKWNKNNGNRQFPIVMKIWPASGFISVVGIKSLLAVISNYSSSTKKYPNTETHKKAFESYVKPEPEFPDSIMHMQLNVQIFKVDIGIPFDLYDTSAFISLHASNLFLSVESASPYSHVLIGIPCVSITFNKTNFPSERFYYERIGDGMIEGNPIEVIHINGINFAIKNSQITKPKPLTLFSLMSIDVGEITGTVSIYQLFAMFDLALNFVHLWFSFDIVQQLKPDLESIFLPRQMQVTVRGIYLIVDFVQYGLMLIHLPSGIIVYQDNMISSESHKAMFISIPTIDVHHIYQPGEEIKNKKKRKKKKTRPFQNSSSSHNKVVYLMDSTTSSTAAAEAKRELEYEEEEEEEEAELKRENISFLSHLRSVFHFTTYVSIIRRGRYSNFEFDSKLQMKYLNEYDPNHQFFNLEELPKNVKLPKIFVNHEVTLDDEYTLTQKIKPDPNNGNAYELPIHEIFFTGQEKYVKADVSQLWLHLFQIQRFSNFNSEHKKDVFDLVEPDPKYYYELRRDMHTIISPKTTALINIEYILVLMLMVKTFNLQPDSHFLSSIARDVETDLWMKKILKKSNMSILIPNILVTFRDFNQELKIDFIIRNIDLVKLNELGISNEMSLFINDISLNVYSKHDTTAAASLIISLITLGKVNGDTAIRINQIVSSAPNIPPLLRVTNSVFSVILPIVKQIESPSVGCNMNDFKHVLERYIDEDEDLDVYYHPEEQNDTINNISTNIFIDANDDNDNSHDHNRVANKVKNHLPKLHRHHKKKRKLHHKKDDYDDSQKEEDSTDSIDDKDSVVDEEKNTSITRYFLAYAKVCSNRKSIMNFVDNFQFDEFEEDENDDEIQTVFDDNKDENIRGNFESGNYQNSPQNDEQKENNPQTEPNKIKSENDIKLDNGIRSKSTIITRTVVRISKIQFSLYDNYVHIKLDPISLITKDNDFGVRFVIRSINANLKDSLVNFIYSIRKPKKDNSNNSNSAASKKFHPRKPLSKKKEINNDKFVIHFILNSLQISIEYLSFQIESISALLNLSHQFYASLSLKGLQFGDQKYALIYLGGFDFNYSKKVNHGSFCLNPIGIKVSLDLLLNPAECIDMKIFKLNRLKKRRHLKKSKIELKKKTEKLIQNVKATLQNEFIQTIPEIINNISFFIVIKEIKIEATFESDANFAANFLFPGTRGCIFQKKNLITFLYFKKPEISVTNILSVQLIDLFMYGFYEQFPKEIKLFTTSGDLKVKTCKETLKKVASLINYLMSRRPEKSKSKNNNNTRHLGRKSVAAVKLEKQNSGSSVNFNRCNSKQKSKAMTRIDNLSNNAIKVVNSISSGLKIIIRFTIPLISIDLPEISSILNLVQPTLSIKCRTTMKFTISIKDLNLHIERSSVSVKLSLTRENEEKRADIDDLSVVVTPNLFKQLIRMKDFFVSIKKEITWNEKVQGYMDNVNNSLKSSVKSNVFKFIDLESFSNNSGKSVKNDETSQFELPTVTSDKYVISINNSLINLKLMDKTQTSQGGRRKALVNISDGFILGIASIFLCLETRSSELHNKTATAAQFLLKNLSLEDKSEREKIDKLSKNNFSSVKCEEAKISAVSFVRYVNVDVAIKSFHISIYPTIPFIFTHLITIFKTIQKDVLTIKTARIMGPVEKVSDKKKMSMMSRRRSLTKVTPKSSYVIFNILITNTAVILHSPRSEFTIPSLSVYGDFEKTIANFSTQTLHSTVRVSPIKMSITPSIIHWITKLIKNLQDANLMMMMKRRNSSSSIVSSGSNLDSSPKKHKKVLLLKSTLNLTVLIDQIDFNLGCQPSPVMLFFSLRNFVTHFATKTDSASFKIGEMILTTEKVNNDKKLSFFPDISSYRKKFMSHARLDEMAAMDDNTDRLLSIKLAPIDGLISREIQAFNVDTLRLSVSNKEVEDLFTFYKVWFEPLKDILKEVSSMFFEDDKPKRPPSNPRIKLAPPKQEISQDQIRSNKSLDTIDKTNNSKGILNIRARVQMFSITFGYSGVNGKIVLDIKPILFSQTSLSTNLTIPEIQLFATGFVEGTVEIKPVIFQLNSSPIIDPNSKNSSSTESAPSSRMNSVIIIKSINSNIESYSDPLLSFSLHGIYLFYLLIPPSDQILSLVVDSPRLKMTSQAISKFKRIVSSITDPIKEGILKTKNATVNNDSPLTLQPEVNRFGVSVFQLSTSSVDSDRYAKKSAEKIPFKKVKIAKARLDLLLEKLGVELYKYYVTDKEAVKVTVTRASLTVDLSEKKKKAKNLKKGESFLPEIIRNMNFVFYPMSLLRLFCKNGMVIDKRSVLAIPKIIGSLNTVQDNRDVLYDFNTNFSDSVECSLSITDYEAVMAILMFAVRNIKNPGAADIDEASESISRNDLVIHAVKSSNADEDKKSKKKNKKFNFIPGDYQFSPQFKISLGAKIQPDVEWVLARLGITDEHVVPATLFEYVCIGLQDLLEYIAQTVTDDL